MRNEIFANRHNLKKAVALAAHHSPITPFFFIAANISLFTTRAECDEVLAGLAAELKTYQHRDSNISYVDDQAETRATTTAARLAKAIDDVAHYTAEAARTGLIAAEKFRAENSLIAAKTQRDRLTLATGTQTGSAAFLSEVDGDQIDAQIAVLTTTQTAVTNHKATLPA